MRRNTSKRVDGRCHDGRTRPPAGMCEPCWHKHGAEIPGEAYESANGLGRPRRLCDHHWVDSARLGFPLVRVGVAPLIDPVIRLDRDDAALPALTRLPLDPAWRPGAPQPRGCCSQCWRFGRRVEGVGVRELHRHGRLGRRDVACSVHIARILSLGGDVVELD